MNDLPALVMIESPYRGHEVGSRNRNLAYLERCIRDCVSRGESPYASHKMLTAALDDDVPAERELGIRLGLSWRMRVDKRVFYVDMGWSDGMLHAKKLYDDEGLEYEVRRIDE